MEPVQPCGVPEWRRPVLPQEADPADQPALGQTGIFPRVRYTSGSDDRDFRMVVPESYSPERPIGLLFGFHGNLGSTPRPPYLNYLLYSGFEDTVEEGYWITVSLSVREGEDGWKGAWVKDTDLSTNRDARAVLAAITFLKKYYAIDDNRIFATGFSSGGGFCLSLARCVPTLLAASAPEVPAARNAVKLPEEPIKTASIVTGGTSDVYNTDLSSRELHERHKLLGTEADCYVFDMGHSGPPDDPSVYPPKSWTDFQVEYFLTHPRYSQTRPCDPPFYAFPFRDDFNGPASAPDASRWRVQLFDSAGVLYGPVNWSGEPGVGVRGYKFRVQNGYLFNEPVGTGFQGGLCFASFAEPPFVWKTSFVVDSAGSDLAVWPAIFRNMNGRVVALKIMQTGWQWQAWPTLLAFRSRYQTETLASGLFSLAHGTEYESRVVLTPTEGLSWSVSGGAETLSGTLSSSEASLNKPECGLGLNGTNVSARFGYAELAGSDIAASPRRLDFWRVDPGTSKTLTLNLTNRGEVNLVFNDSSSFGVTGSDLFHIDRPSIDLSDLEPGGPPRAILVTFAPLTITTPTLVTGTLLIESNDYNESPLTIPLTGYTGPVPASCDRNWNRYR